MIFEESSRKSFLNLFPQKYTQSQTIAYSPLRYNHSCMNTQRIPFESHDNLIAKTSNFLRQFVKDGSIGRCCLFGVCGTLGHIA